MLWTQRCALGPECRDDPSAPASVVYQTGQFLADLRPLGFLQSLPSQDYEMESEHFSLAQEQHWGGSHLLHPCLISAQTYTKLLRNRSLVAGVAGGGVSL